MTLDKVDPALVDAFERHAGRFRMTPSHSFNLKLLDHYIDQVAPPDPDPELFDKYGCLMVRELQEYLVRAKQPKQTPWSVIPTMTGTRLGRNAKIAMRRA